MLDGQLSPGDLLAFLLYTLTLAASVALLSNTFGDFMSAVGASGTFGCYFLLLMKIERIFEIIDTVPKIPISEGQLGTKMRGEIEFKDVTFAYPSRTDKLVLDVCV